MTAALSQGLQERETLASTAIGHGVAIPHGRTPLFEHSRAAFLRLAQPVDFGAADGQPVDLVLAMAVPEHHVQQHLQLLAELAERLPGYSRESKSESPALRYRLDFERAPGARPLLQSGHE
ncbi:MAG: PTS sugar transporter subunit IIA [Lysobacter sp.]|nr:PTS sugar transporter subunit IIA [Lysobacter sp.]